MRIKATQKIIFLALLYLIKKENTKKQAIHEL